MTDLSISFAGQRVLISFPSQAAEIVNFTFRNIPLSDKEPIQLRVTIFFNADTQLFSVTANSILAGDNLHPVDLSLLLIRRTAHFLSRNIRTGLLIHGAAVQNRGQTILIPGNMRTRDSILSCWLLSKGYNYVSDESLYFRENKYCQGFCCPIHIKYDDPASIQEIIFLQDTKDSILQDGTNILCYPLPSDSNPVQPESELSCLLFAEQNDHSSLALTPISPAQTTKRLLEAVAGPNNKDLQTFKHLSSIARETPALLVQYKTHSSLENILEPILDFVLENRCTPRSFQNFTQAVLNLPSHTESTLPSQANIRQPSPIPAATKPGEKRKLTIGMATYDDYDGVYFSIQALQMYHSEITKNCEILVIDNHPDGPCSESLKNLEDQIDGYRYIPLPDTTGTAVRDYIFTHATSDFVLCMDCHVFLVPGALQKLFNYLETHELSQDLLQGPMLKDTLLECSTHFKPEWKKGMYGTWEEDKRGTDPEGEAFEIPMQGLGLFVCRKDAWPRFNPKFRGFGGEEGYIHEKFRQAGGKTLCLPFLRWMHRFARPMGVPYPLKWEDRIWNYWIGFSELNLSLTPMKNHFQELLGKDAAQGIFSEIEEELQSPFSFFDAIYCITLTPDSKRWQEIEKRFRILGIHRKIRIFRAIHTPHNHHIGCALSHRGILAIAKDQGLRNVLVFEDDAIFLDQTDKHLKKSIAELKNQEWNLFYLGGHRWGAKFKKPEGCSHLQLPQGITCTHAIAYNSSIYEQILNDLPDSVKEMENWVGTKLAIDQYLCTLSKPFLAFPPVATQIELLPQEEERYRSHFILESKNCPTQVTRTSRQSVRAKTISDNALVTANCERQKRV